MKIFLQKVSPFLSLALWLAAQGLYVQVHCTQLGAQLRFKILVIWLNNWTRIHPGNWTWIPTWCCFLKGIYIYIYIYISNQNMAKLRIHVKFHECNTKNWVPTMKKTHLKPPSFFWIHPFQEDAFVMDVAWLQRDSFHTLELSVQDTDFSFDKIIKFSKSTDVLF